MTAEEISGEAGIHPEMLNYMVELGIIEPIQREPEELFNADALRTITVAMRLRNQLGVNWAGIGLVLDLLDRIRDMENENRSLKARLERFEE